MKRCIYEKLRDLDRFYAMKKIVVGVSTAIENLDTRGNLKEYKNGNRLVHQ